MDGSDNKETQHIKPKHPAGPKPDQDGAKSLPQPPDVVQPAEHKESKKVERLKSGPAGGQSSPRDDVFQKGS